MGIPLPSFSAPSFSAPSFSAPDVSGLSAPSFQIDPESAGKQAALVAGIELLAVALAFGFVGSLA